MPKLAKKPIWLVEIVIPKQLMREIHRGSVELEAESVDLEDIEQSYEVGLDDDVYKQDEDENAQPAAQPAQPGLAPQPVI